MALDPLLVLYRDPVHILNITRQYWTAALSPSRCKVQSLTVQDAVQLIGQALSTIESPQPLPQKSGRARYPDLISISVLQ